MALTNEDKAWIAGLMDVIGGRLNAIDGRLDSMDGRLNAIEGRLNAIEGRLNAIEGRLNAIEGRLNAIDGQLKSVDGRFDAIDARFDRVEDYIQQFRTAIIRQFEIIEQRLDFLASSFSRIDVQLPAVNKSVIEFGILAGQFAREQMLTKEHDAELASRVARLEDKLSRLINPAA